MFNTHILKEFQKNVTHNLLRVCTVLILVLRREVLSGYRRHRLGADVASGVPLLYAHRGHVTLVIDGPVYPVTVNLGIQVHSVVSDMHLSVSDGLDRSRTTGENT